MSAPVTLISRTLARTVARTLSATAFAAVLVAAPISALTSAASAQDALPRPTIGEPKPFTLPEVESFTLANGMEVTLIPYGLAPKTTISARVRVGNLNDGENTWLADLTGEMIKEGSAGRSSEDIAQAVAAMGGDLNIGVGLHVTTFSVQVLSEYGVDALNIVADAIIRPDFPESELERVQQNLMRDVAVSLSQPGPIANQAFAAAYYGTDHPYGRTYPTEEQMSGYTLDDVTSFYGDNFGAARTRLYVAGQFDVNAMRTAIERAFGPWASGELALSLPATPTPGPQIILVDRPGAAQSTLRLAFPAPTAHEGGDIELRVMNALLGGAFTSRLVQNLREDKGYTYSPDSSVTRHPSDAYWLFDADVTTDVTGASLRETFDEIIRLQTETPPEEEAAGMRNYMAGIFVLRNASTGGLIGQLEGAPHPAFIVLGLHRRRSRKRRAFSSKRGSDPSAACSTEARRPMRS